MWKRIVPVVFLLLILTVPVFAAGESDYIGDQIQASGANDLFGELPEETKQLLEELGIDSIDFSSLSALSPRVLLKMFLDLLTGKLVNPLKAGLRILGVLLLFAILEAFRDGDRRFHTTDGFASALFIILLIAQPITDCIAQTSAAIRLSADFMLLFIPILAAIIAAGGNPAAAVSCNAMVFGAAQAIAQGARLFLVPGIGIFLGLNLVCSFSPDIPFGKVSDFIKKIITSLLGLAMTVFVGLLGLKSALSKAVDTVAIRGAKFLVGSFLPVVGGPLGDALGTVLSSLSVVKSTVGIFGILAVALINIPVVVELLLWLLCLHTTALCAELLDQKNLAALLRGIAGALSLLNIVLVCNMVLLLISTAVMLLIKADV